MRKLERFLRIVVLVLAAYGFWALGLNQFSSWLRVSREDKVAYNEALLGCFRFGASEVIFIDDVPYCHMIYKGTDFVAPLEELQKSNPTP